MHVCLYLYIYMYIYNYAGGAQGYVCIYTYVCICIHMQEGRKVVALGNVQHMKGNVQHINTDTTWLQAIRVDPGEV
jgi:hypothetical protein